MNSTVESLRQELEGAFRNRAHLYRVFLDDLEAELGLEKAQEIMSRTLERRGRETAVYLFRDCPSEPGAVGDRFLTVSPDAGRMYPHDTDRTERAMTIRVRRCPLKDAWSEAGLPPARIAALCRIAGAFDKGLFEAAGVRFSNETWTEERGGGCCKIILQAHDHDAERIAAAPGGPMAGP
jgi:L-2-amino-thiazoline-4-carboxylic acid hydrolase